MNGTEHRLVGFAAALLWSAATFAAPTPLDAPLAEGRTTEIECAYAGSESFRSFGKAQKGIYHYRVVVPQGYAQDKDSRYPCIFSMGPGGGGSTGKAEKWFKENRWIIIQLTEARNGPWEPIFGCFLAANDDAVKRLRIAEGQKYATGFSGGARGSSVFVNLRPGFAGLWCQGAGFAYTSNDQHVTPPPHVAVYGSFGSTDGNLTELQYMRKIQSPFAYEIHDGGHTAGPYDTMERALDWFEQQLCLNNPQAKVTPAQAAACFEKRRAAFEAASTPFAKHRQALFCQKLAAKYPSLAAVAKPLLAQLPALEQSPAIKAEKAAQTAYVEAQASELRLRTGGTYHGKADPNAEARLVTLYGELAAKHKDTEFGKLAAERVAALKNPGKGK